jgi:hypothetical protein
VELPNGNVATGQAACVACHNAPVSKTSSDLLLPALNTSSVGIGCRECHGGETTSKAVPSGCAMCHDFHMDTGAPAMLIRDQKARGRKQANPVIAGVAPEGPLLARAGAGGKR